MFWELIATVFAGIGGAGIALILRKLSKQTMPKWLVPSFAGIAMIGFQVQGEYDWYEHQTSLLPEGVVVVKAVQEETLFRPWSYAFPQTMRFMAADVANSAKNKIDPNLILVDLYFFERRHVAKRVPQIIDCVQGARTDFLQSSSASADSAANITQKWHPLDKDDLLLKALCHQA